MNKSDIVETFRERVTKQNPWQPYTGPAGGQGWVNVITGEKRYQENRPDPGEGMPEDYEGDIPQPDVDVEGFTPTEPTVEDYQEYLEEGMEVEGEVDGMWVGGEVQVIGESAVVIEDQVDGEPYEIPFEDLENPVEFEPWDGYGDGWQEAPEEFTDLTSDQTVEVYNLETGQYMEGRVQMIYEDDPGFEGDYISIVTEEEGTIEIVPGIGTGEEYMITAAEDMEFTEGVPAEFEEVTIDDLEDLDDGDVVMVEVDDASFPDEPQEGVYDEEEHAVNVRAEGQDFYVNPDYHADKITGLWTKPPEMLDLSEVPGLDPDDPETYWPMLTGGLANVALPGQEPTEGSVSHVKTDDQGHGWFGVEGEPDPSIGDTFTAGGVEYEIEDFDEEMGTTHVLMVDEDLNGHEWLLEDVVDQVEPETTMVTTNPESPLYIGETLQQVESPFSEPRGDEDIKLGDQVVIDGEVYEVDGGILDQDMIFLEPDAPGPDEFTHDELLEFVDGIHTHDSKEPPSKSPDKDWVSPVKHEEGVGVTLKPIKEGSHIYYHDAETGEMKVGEAAEFTQDNDIELTTGETVNRADVTGFARDERTNVVEPGHLNTGDEISVKVGDDEISGAVMEVSTVGTTTVDILTEDGIETIRPGRPNTAISEHSDEAETFKPSAWEYDEEGNIVDEVPTEDLVSDIQERVDFTHRDSENRLEKDDPLRKEAKKQLRAELYRQFGAETVDEYYEMKSAWKGNSASHPNAERLERAYKEALGIKAPHRDNGGQAPDPEHVKMAEAIAHISQDYFRETMGEEAELARGSSGQAWASFVDQFLSDPNQEEYNLSFLANNNHTTDFRGTADKWNVFTAQHVVEAEGVLSMTDHLFEASHQGELEIGVHGDGHTVTLDGIRPGHQGYESRTRGLSSNIESWDEQQIDKFWDSMAQATGKIGYDDFGPGQLENLRRLVEQHDAKAHQTSNEVERARGVLVENGLPPEGSDISSEFSYDDFEGIDEVTEFEWGEGVEAKFTTEFGDTMEGEIMGLDDDGDIIAWAMTDPTDSTPQEFYLEEDDILDMDVDQLNDLQAQAALPTGGEMMEQYATDLDDLGQLDEVYYTHGGDLKEGTVLDVTPDGTVEISGEYGQTEYFDQYDVENGMVVPSDEVDADALGEPSGPDLPSHDQTDLVVSNPGLYDLDPGDLVTHGMDVYEVKETPTTSTGEFTVVGSDGDTKTLQDWEIDEKVQPENDDDDAITPGEVIEHLEGGPEHGVYFDLPENYEGEGVGEATAMVGGDLLYETPDGEEHWASEEVVAENAVSIGHPPDGPEDAVDEFENADVGDTVTYQDSAGTTHTAEVEDTFEDSSTGDPMLVTEDAYVSPPGSGASDYEFVPPEGSDAPPSSISLDGADVDVGETIVTESETGNQMEWEVTTNDEGDVMLYHPESDSEHNPWTVMEDQSLVDTSEEWDPTEEVGPGDEVLVPHYDDDGPHMVDDIYQDEHDTYGFVMEDGDVLDADQLAPYEPEMPDIGDEGDEGGFDPEEALEDLGIGGDDYIAPEDASSATLGVGDEFETEIHGEPTTVEVVETSADPAYPVEVEDTFGDRWLLWDDGNVEEV